MLTHSDAFNVGYWFGLLTGLGVAFIVGIVAAILH